MCVCVCVCVCVWCGEIETSAKESTLSSLRLYVTTMESCHGM